MSAVKEGREEDVMTYMSTADQTSHDWQKNLDQSVVIAIKEKQSNTMSLLVNAGANLDQINDGIPLLFKAFESADIKILDTFLKNYKGDIISQLKAGYLDERNFFTAHIDERLDAAKSLLQENNITFDQIIFAALVVYDAMKLRLHNRNSANADDHDQDTSITSYDCAILKYLLDRGLNVKCSDVLTDTTPLHLAATRGNMEVVQYLIMHGADVMARNFRYETPLHLAVKGENMEVIQCLITNGADVMAKAFADQTPLHLAVKSENVEVVQCLITNGADVMAKDIKHQTPLHLAAEGENVQVVQCLITNGADMMAKDYADQTPVHLAVCYENVEVVQCLIMNGADVMAEDNKNQTPLHLGAEGESVEVVQCLITNGADVMAKDIKHQTPLHLAAEGENVEVVQCLITNGADVMAKDDENQTPLHVAAKSENVEVIQCLITNGANVMAKDNEDQTPLHLAANGENVEVVQCLMQNGADVMVMDKERVYPCMTACNRKNLIIMTELLKGVDLKQKLLNGRYYLHESCLCGWIDGTKYLLENGADVNCIDDSNLTALFVVMLFYQYIYDIPTNTPMDHGYRYEIPAVYFGNDRELMQILGDYGVDVNHRDKNRHTLLMKKEVYKQKDKREFLIQRGADINVAGADGLTVLWTAIEYDCEAEFYLIDDLLARNLDIGLSWHVYNGMTPLQLAYSRGNYELCDTLLDARCSLCNMLEFMDANINLESDENMQRVKRRILKLNSKSYSLQELSRQAVLRVIGSGNLVEKVHVMKEEGLLPINLLNFLIRNLGFELEETLIPWSDS